jgi:hypothetical protein
VYFWVVAQLKLNRIKIQYSKIVLWAMVRWMDRPTLQFFPAPNDLLPQDNHWLIVVYSFTRLCVCQWADRLG